MYAYRSGTAAPATVASATATTAGVTQYNTYLANNTANPLVNFDIATTSGNLGKQAIILYQKYLALNSIASTEAWDDYRRAAQPKLPASTQSGIASRADKLPTRLLYPLSESSTNGANIPVVTNTTKIFWDVVD
ncbi:MAG: SusD/RagB family nutrient-binding outer membrane lipoprotein [Hymenobacter sp.]|nr:MAG: SusD/RagB family nutrient-binding outer membrane lipoprotein [Hymenobacter sp.]